MARTQIEIKGLKELDETLKQLPEAMGRRVLTTALRKGAEVVKDAAVALAPVSDDPRHAQYGHLRDNIKVSSSKEEMTSARVVVHTGRAFWAAFLEFGTRNRRIKSKKVMSDGKIFYGVEVGRVVARPFMRPAFETSKAAAAIQMSASLGLALERAAKRLAKIRSSG